MAVPPSLRAALLLLRLRGMGRYMALSCGPCHIPYPRCTLTFSPSFWPLHLFIQCLVQCPPPAQALAAPGRMCERLGVTELEIPSNQSHV